MRGLGKGQSEGRGNEMTMVLVVMDLIVRHLFQDTECNDFVLPAFIRQYGFWVTQIKNHNLRAISLSLKMSINVISHNILSLW